MAKMKVWMTLKVISHILCDRVSRHMTHELVCLVILQIKYSVSGNGIELNTTNQLLSPQTFYFF